MVCALWVKFLDKKLCALWVKFLDKQILCLLSEVFRQNALCLLGEVFRQKALYPLGEVLRQTFLPSVVTYTWGSTFAGRQNNDPDEVLQLCALDFSPNLFISFILHDSLHHHKIHSYRSAELSPHIILATPCLILVTMFFRLSDSLFFLPKLVNTAMVKFHQITRFIFF